MIIGGPFAFLAGLFSLGAAGVGEVARDAKIKAGTPELNEYGYYKQRNIANLNDDYFQSQIKANMLNEPGAPRACKYFGGLDNEKVAFDFIKRHNLEEFYQQRFLYWNDYRIVGKLQELYLDRIMTLAGIETTAFYKAKDHMEYFTDPQWRNEYYEIYKNWQNTPSNLSLNYEKSIWYQRDLEKEAECERNFLGQFDWQYEHEKKEHFNIWCQINGPQGVLDGARHRYAGQYTNLVIPDIKIQFLEEVVEQKEDEAKITK